MRPSFLLSVTLAGAFTLGCGEDGAVTAPVSDPSLAEKSRFEQVFILSLNSEDPPITSVFGVSPEELPGACAGGELSEFVEGVSVIHPTHGGLKEHVRLSSKEMCAIIWPIDLGPGGDLCTLLGVPPLIGTVNFMLNDNEGGFFETSPGANAFSIRVVGTVTDSETGQRYHVLGSIRVVVLADGSVKELPSKFPIQLTPQGN
jgi:hypothetical protein